jgi:hypothetical protein
MEPPYSLSVLRVNITSDKWAFYKGLKTDDLELKSMKRSGQLSSWLVVQYLHFHLHNKHKPI